MENVKNNDNEEEKKMNYFSQKTIKMEIEKLVNFVLHNYCYLKKNSSYVPMISGIIYKDYLDNTEWRYYGANDNKCQTQQDVECL